MTYSKYLFFVLKVAGKFIGMHILILVLLLGIMYAFTGIPLYYTYDSGLKGAEIYFLYLIYAVIVFPINIHFIHNKINTVKHEKNIYKVQIWTAYILLAPALVIVTFSLLFSIFLAHI